MTTREELEANRVVWYAGIPRGVGDKGIPIKLFYVDREHIVLTQNFPGGDRLDYDCFLEVPNGIKNGERLQRARIFGEDVRRCSLTQTDIGDDKRIFLTDLNPYGVLYASIIPGEKHSPAVSKFICSALELIPNVDKLTDSEKADLLELLKSA